MKSSRPVLNAIKGGLIVSCQALPYEPLHGSEIMSKMALAAQRGGAIGIRANTVEDIRAIRTQVDLPIIGIIKKDYPDCPVFITPTAAEVDALVEAHVDIIAIDATNRPRPGGKPLEAFFMPLRSKYPDTVFMADCSTLADAVNAQRIGFDCVGSTLSGYTNETKNTPLPNLTMIREMSSTLDLPVIAEGGIWTPEQLVQVFQSGAWTAVVGTAITRPMEITQRYQEALLAWKHLQSVQMTSSANNS
ncbi:MAG: N-acetylmannosamine-6-phosphate 2-epimerase [Clostridia bacterium]